MLIVARGHEHVDLVLQEPRDIVAMLSDQRAGDKICSALVSFRSPPAELNAAPETNFGFRTEAMPFELL